MPETIRTTATQPLVWVETSTPTSPQEHGQTNPQFPRAAERGIRHQASASIPSTGLAVPRVVEEPLGKKGSNGKLQEAKSCLQELELQHLQKLQHMPRSPLPHASFSAGNAHGEESQAIRDEKYVKGAVWMPIGTMELCDKPSEGSVDSRQQKQHFPSQEGTGIIGLIDPTRARGVIVTDAATSGRNCSGAWRGREDSVCIAAGYDGGAREGGGYMTGKLPTTLSHNNHPRSHPVFSRSPRTAGSKVSNQHRHHQYWLPSSLRNAQSALDSRQSAQLPKKRPLSPNQILPSQKRMASFNTATMPDYERYVTEADFGSDFFSQAHCHLQSHHPGSPRIGDETGYVSVPVPAPLKHEQTYPASGGSRHHYHHHQHNHASQHQPSTIWPGVLTQGTGTFSPSYSSGSDSVPYDPYQGTQFTHQQNGDGSGTGRPSNEVFATYNARGSDLGLHGLPDQAAQTSVSLQSISGYRQSHYPFPAAYGNGPALGDASQVLGEPYTYHPANSVQELPVATSGSFHQHISGSNPNRRVTNSTAVQNATQAVNQTISGAEDCQLWPLDLQPGYSATISPKETRLVPTPSAVSIDSLPDIQSGSQRTVLPGLDNNKERSRQQSGDTKSKRSRKNPKAGSSDAVMTSKHSGSSQRPRSSPISDVSVPVAPDHSMKSKTGRKTRKDSSSKEISSSKPGHRRKHPGSPSSSAAIYSPEGVAASSLPALHPSQVEQYECNDPDISHNLGYDYDQDAPHDDSSYDDTPSNLNHMLYGSPGLYAYPIPDQSGVDVRGSSGAASSLSKEEAERRRKDQYLVKCKLAGVPYRQIKINGNFSEAESTLRGRFRTLTKKKEERVRKPEWSLGDLRLLKQAVLALCAGGDMVNPKISWKAVAEYITENGGSYQFGYATCRKKWDEVGHEMASANF
ncbi:uncharacterized protein MKZ38_007843 [Zalerion maritima]|uniref:Myb-like domain-containing protein n=1 Tax=Zalerion maritima TaxID=339359 RepID=A0AAD5WPH5_9PEZI|nr:uncharacterized protein MKZ38_007843 [Zalerion maritima]